MSTANFHNVNASCVFSYELEDEYDYDDLIANLESELAGIACDYRFDGSDPHQLRSYPSRVIGGLGRSRSYDGIEIAVELTVIVRSGYYRGCNLDWYLGYSIAGDETEERDFTELFAEAGCSIKMAAYLAKLAEKWAAKTAAKMIAAIETMFRRYSQPLNIVGRFSNGETIYEKAV